MIQKVVAQLSPVHREVTVAVVTFLRELVVHGQSNGLTSASLGGMMGPVLLRRKDVEVRAF